MRRARKVIGAAVVAALLLAATALISLDFASLRQLARALAGARWPWIAGGVAVHLAFFVAYAVLYRLGFDLVGVASRTWSLVPLVLAGMFLNVFVPAGAGSVALFIDDAERRGGHGARAAVGVVLVLLLDLATLLPFVVWGVWFLADAGLCSAWELAAAVAFTLYLVLLVLLLVLARRRAGWVARALVHVRRAVVRVAGWFGKRDALAEDWPARTAVRFRDAAAAIGARRGRVVLAAVWAFALHVINLFGLWLFVRGFGAEVALGGLTAAFAIGIVFFVVAAIPQAAPVVEATMMAIFIHIGASPGRAVAATLAFRGVNFWLPLVLGFVFAWRIRRFGQRA